MPTHFDEHLNNLLSRVERLIRDGHFEDQETDTIEIKPVPPERGAWRKIAESANAFLNTRGGIIILGIKEEQTQGKKSMSSPATAPRPSRRSRNSPKNIRTFRASHSI